MQISLFIGFMGRKAKDAIGVGLEAFLFVEGKELEGGTDAVLQLAKRHVGRGRLETSKVFKDEALEVGGAVS